MADPADRPWNQPQRTPIPSAIAQHISTWSTPQKMGAGIGSVLAFVVAMVNWHLLMLLLFTGTVVGFAVRSVRVRAERHRQQAETREARARDITSYHAMGPREFEHAIAYLCQRDGCTGVQVVGGADDLGADVIATAPDGRRVVIQCKRYTLENQISGPELQNFGGACYAVHQAGVAAVVATSGFTRQAREYATHMRIRLWDNDALAGWASGTGPAPWQ